MKKIIDSSYLQRGTRSYLSEGRDRIAIVPDQLAMELFKGTGATDVKRSLQAFADFPDQVLVLRSTHKIVKIRPKPDAIEASFVDLDQTRQFRRYCQALRDETLDPADRKEKQGIANARYQRQLQEIGLIRDSIRKYEGMISPEDLKNLRAKRPPSAQLVGRFTEDVINGTVNFLRTEMNEDPPQLEELIYMYPFRYTLCALSRAIDWIMLGGYQTTPDEKLMNDYTDMAYAAYGTYFDGVLTNDTKLAEIHKAAHRMLTEWFLPSVG